MLEFLVFIVVAVIIFLVVKNNVLSNENFQKIDFKQIKIMLDEGSATLLDVRTIEEVKETGIIKDGINIPIDDLEKKLNLLDKETTYITICAAGGRSKKAASILSKNGFKKVYTAIEGMNTWPYTEMIEKDITKVKRF